MNWRRAATVILVAIACVVASAGTLAVTAAGFALSFDAIRAVGKAAYISPGITWMLPVAIDGAMAVAMVTAIVLRWLGRSPWYPWAVVLVGAAVSIACNAAHARIQGGALQLPTEAAMAVSAIPAATLALSVHMLIVLAIAVVSGPPTDDATDAPAPTQPATQPAPVAADPTPTPFEPAPEVLTATEGDAPAEPVTAGQRARQDDRAAEDVTATILALRAVNPDWSVRRIAAAAGRSEATVRRALGPANAAPVSGPPAAESTSESAELVGATQP